MEFDQKVNRARRAGDMIPSHLIIKTPEQVPFLSGNHIHIHIVHPFFFIFIFFFGLILEDCVHVAVDTDMCNVDFVP